MDTANKPAPTKPNKHWTEVPQRVTEMHNATRDLINDYDLTKPQGAEWTPETFIIEKGIDTSKDYSVVRNAIREAAKQAYVDDLTTILIENGVTELADQQKAFAPYESLQEVVTMTGVNIKRIRTQVCSYATSHFKEAALASTHKEQPKMTPEEKQSLLDIPFGDNPKLSDHFGLPDQTINPDLDDAPKAPTEKPAESPLPETVKPASADEIEGLRKDLIATLFDAFPGVGNAALKVHMTTALKASTFSDFILRYKTITEAGAAGKELIKGYIDVTAPQRATEPPQSAAEPRSLPAVVNRPQNGNGASALMTGNQQWDTRVIQAQMMLNSGLMPEGIDTVEKILTIGMMGEQLGIPMIVAVNNIDVIKGKPSIKPQLMLALIRRSGQLENSSIEDDGTTCTVKMKRKGETEHVSTFSVQDATRMYLTKNQWITQPATMRKWRAISAACRVVFPDIIWGFYTPEELDPDVIVAED